MIKGTHHTNESKKRMSLSQKGKKSSEETRRRMSIANKGEKNNMYGKRRYGKDNPFYGKHHTEEAKRNMSIAKKGKKLNFTEEHRKNLSLAMQDEKILENNRNRMKGNQYRKGVLHTEETKRNMSLSRRGSNNNFYGKTHTDKWKREHSGKNNHRYGKCGELHPNWLGGKSFEPYTPDFNKRFKKLIRERDNHCCVICNKPQEELNELLSVHHIDYNKKNSFPQNCVSLCRKHHIETNNNRKSWTIFFQSLLTERYDYEYTQDQKIILDFVKNK